MTGNRKRSNDVNRTRAVIVCLFLSFVYLPSPFGRVLLGEISSHSKPSTDKSSAFGHSVGGRGLTLKRCCRRVLEEPFKASYYCCCRCWRIVEAGVRCDDAAHSDTIGIAPGGTIRIDLDFDTRCTCEYMINVEHAVIRFFSFFLLFSFLFSR